MIQLNFRDARPIYEQVKEGFRQLILTGALPADTKLPSVRELAGELAINPNTIQRAYRELEAEGYICSVPGRGSFVRDVSKGALDGLNVTVPRGAVYGLVGPNGAGKSTLIRHLAGIYRQDSGTVLVDGTPVYENPAVKARIAYVPDEVFYYTQASLMDMLRLPRDLYPSFDQVCFEKLAGAFPIDPKRPLRKLSRGQQKQAAFWLALSQRPELVILEGDVAERGTTVLVSSHNLRELEDVCDHVGIMDHGKMLVERSLSELQENMVKIQLAMPEGKELPEGLEILHESRTGRLRQLILRGDAGELSARLQAAGPLFLDLLPLTLEEIFIYELGGVDHEVKNILL